MINLVDTISELWTFIKLQVGNKGYVKIDWEPYNMDVNSLYG
jgi:hypothetical protein